jgi:hypothetical protein
MTGLVGFSSGYAAMKNCGAPLLLGTDFAYRAFYPERAKIAQLDVRSDRGALRRNWGFPTRQLASVVTPRPGMGGSMSKGARATPTGPELRALRGRWRRVSPVGTLFPIAIALVANSIDLCSNDPRQRLRN